VILVSFEKAAVNFSKMSKLNNPQQRVERTYAYTN